ncbi:hypothetical protein RB595_003717 [Gaeumannomyces hyphopodioides]
MQLSEDERCRLLFAVYPAFVEALPTIFEPMWTAPPYASGPVPSAAALSRDNAITELRDEIKKIGITINEEGALCELQDESFQDARDALVQILFHFEKNLVCDSIAKAIPEYSESEELIHLFPKLVRLRHMMSSHRAEKASSLISFGTEPSVYYWTISAAQLFNRTMRKIYSHAGGMANRQPFRAMQRDDRAHSATLARALHLSEASSRLFAFLERLVCREAKGPHEGYLRLSDFAQPELDMLLSVCRRTGVWQQAYFRPANEGMQGAVVESMCNELRRSLGDRKPTRMVIDKKGLHRVTGTRDRTKGRSPENVTLRHILREEEGRRRQGAPSHRTLKCNKKRGLAVKIAAALLHLFSSPLLQARPWNADAIYISHDGTLGADSDPQAYVSFCLDSQPAVSASSRVEAEDGDPSLLALTAILLELETEKEIILCDEDIDELSGEPSLYMAVIRYHDELKDNVDDSFYGIIDDCLDLYTNSRDMDRNGYHTKIQTELFNKVVVPLTERYETFRNARQQTTRRTRDGDCGLSMDLGLATSRAGYFGCPDRRMNTIAETAEDETQYEAHAVAASYTSVIIPEPQFLAGKLMDRICEKHPTKNKVRVAILDTGCDVNADCIVNLSDGEARLEGHWRDWVAASTSPIDDDPKRHGTSVVSLLLRVARHAEIFVGRIARNQAGLNGATDNIVNAISYAAVTWNVDIVSMSFGFDVRIRDVEKAISEAITRRKEAGRDILFFAAANNDGLNYEEMFPASDANVISVRGTDHSGTFLQKYNPNPRPNKRGLARFGTLADNVPYDCADKHSSKSGCSLATPILAGLVATVVQYVEHMGDDGLRRGVRTKDGILQVMNHMAHSNDLGHKYIAPWKFFEKDDEGRIALIRHALDELQHSR